MTHTIRIISGADSEMAVTAKYYFETFGFHVTDNKNIKNIVYVTNNRIEPKHDESGLYICVRREQDVENVNFAFDTFHRRQIGVSYNFKPIKVASLIELPLKLEQIYFFSNLKFKKRKRKRWDMDSPGKAKENGFRL